MLLRVGIDKSSDGVLSPIFSDGTFEYIPLSEKDDQTIENRTYYDIIGIKGKKLSIYLPKKIATRKVHMDPEFINFTYGDEGKKATYLRKLNHNDILVFYAGLKPYEENEYPEALYIIGYFTIKDIIDFKNNKDEIDSINTIRTKFSHNSHPKRFNTNDLVFVVGDPEKSKLLDRPIQISQKKLNKIGRNYHAVSPEMEVLLGIEGSIQRSIPPRFINDGKKLKNLKKLLDL
ncbi:MAG TPA: hypothetical protein GXZ72_03630 [Methanobacterium sp.]|nr:hypothetical protein [Methanobacterium sp.]